MIRAFADTSFYQALLNPSDSWHAAALNLSAVYFDQVVTTEYVLLELGALMSRGNTRALFIEIVETLRSDSATQVVAASPELFQAGFDLFARRPDKDWSLTDCISFSLMEKYGITDALTSDRHFG